MDLKAGTAAKREGVRPSREGKVSRMMMPRLPRWAVAGLGFVLAAGLLWWWVVSQLGGTVRLPDGRKVAVQAVTYGTNHGFIEGKFLAKIARPIRSLAKSYELC